MNKGADAEPPRPGRPRRVAGARIRLRVSAAASAWPALAGGWRYSAISTGWIRLASLFRAALTRGLIGQSRSTSRQPGAAAPRDHPRPRRATPASPPPRSRPASGCGSAPSCRWRRGDDREGALDLARPPAFPDAGQGERRTIARAPRRGGCPCPSATHRTPRRAPDSGAGRRRPGTSP